MIRIDWTQVTTNIRKAGISLASASRKCGREDSWLGHISRGDVTRVEFHDGLRLLDYHLKVCGDEEHVALLGKKG